MHAYVKYEKKCPRHSEKGIISVHKIRHFTKTAINYSKLYNIKCGSSYCAGVVLMVAESAALLETKIKSKRAKIPTRKNIESASDLTDDETRTEKAVLKKTANREAALREIVKTKVNTVKARFQPMEEKTQDGETTCVGITNTEKINEPCSKKSDHDKTEKSARKTTCKASSKKLFQDEAEKIQIKNSHEEITKKSVHNVQQVQETKVRKENSMEDDNKVKSQKKPSALKENHKEKSSECAQEEMKTGASLPKSAILEDFQMCSQCQILASKERALLNKKLREALKNNEDLKNQTESLRASRDEEREIGKQMQLLNIELQNEVIDFFHEVKSNTTEVMKQAQIHVLQDDTAVPVGHLRNRDQTIHHGHGVWLKESTYKAAIMNARTPSIFVKNMAVAVFGVEVLANSSVTGKISNRKGKKKSDDEKAKPKLDPKKLMAIKDIYKHWLAKNGRDEVEIGLLADKVGTIISHKIGDLNRPEKTKKKKDSPEKAKNLISPDCSIDGDDKIVDPEESNKSKDSEPENVSILSNPQESESSLNTINFSDDPDVPSSRSENDALGERTRRADMNPPPTEDSPKKKRR